MTMATASDPRRQILLSGLTDAEAREFHSLFITSFIGFTVIAIIAHILVWMWRPVDTRSQGLRAASTAPRRPPIT